MREARRATMTARVSGRVRSSPSPSDGGEEEEEGEGAGAALGGRAGRASKADSSSSRRAVPVATAARSARVKRRDGPRCSTGLRGSEEEEEPLLLLPSAMKLEAAVCVCVVGVWLWVCEKEVVCGLGLCVVVKECRTGMDGVEKEEGRGGGDGGLGQRFALACG